MDCSDITVGVAVALVKCKTFLKVDDIIHLMIFYKRGFELTTLIVIETK